MTLSRILATVCIAIATVAHGAIAKEATEMLFDFEESNASQQWQTVNDGVMGGVSVGRFRVTDAGLMEFFGTLSLENNGGFTSVRSKPQSLGLSANASLVVRVRGDGRQYTMNLYVPTNRVAFSYRAEFDTKKGEWMEVALPVKSFEAISFGRRVADAGPVDASKVNSVGILLSDKKPGPFKLQVAWIKVTDNQAPEGNAARREQSQDNLPAPPDGKTWKMVFEDEFGGTELNQAKWGFRPDGPRKGGWWNRKAISLDGEGHLAITTFMDGDKPTTGCVITQGKFEHVFGYYVARVKFQRQPGHWSAFWITGTGVSQVGDGGRDGTEIDIMEKPWLDDRVQHALHWDGYGEHHQSAGFKANVPGVMDGWHTFALHWQPNEYVFYVDGKETWRTRAGGVCQVPQYILLSDEIGSWAGDIEKANLPDRFLVDYVRVYDLVNEP